jgi:Cu2+-exporting ATPase
VRHALPISDNKPDAPAPEQDVTRFVVNEKDGGHVLHMMVEGMRCASCAFLIEDTLNKEAEVAARVNLTTRRLSLRWRGDAVRANMLLKKVSAIGYKLMPFDAAQIEDADSREEKFLLRCLAVAGFASGNIMMLSIGLWSSTEQTMGMATRDFLHWLSALIAIPTVLFAGRPFFRSAWGALRHKRTNMDVPISVALTLTTGMSLFEVITHGEYAYFDSVTMLLFLLLIGRYLDRRTRGKARAAAQDLLMMMAGTATVVEDGQMRLLPIRELQSGMLLHIASGEKIAADGVVESGTSEVDPSFISGETLTLPVTGGTRVFGGMVNVSAPLTVRLSASSGDSLLGEVIRLMEKAEQGHAHYVRIADRIARYYTPVVHFLAAVTFITWCFILGRTWQPSLLAAMTVLIITCPCALGLAVPAVQVLTSGRLFRRGMLLKSADAIERMAQVDTIVFDKTGTLTQGRPRLANPAQIGSRNMQLAVSMAAHSKHPLARALHDMYGGKLVEMNVAEFPGQGLEAHHEGKLMRLGRRDWCGDNAAAADDSPELWLGVEGETPVRFAFADELRSDAALVIGELRRRGYQLHLLSGDREPAVAAVAASLGLTEFHARVSPIDKAAKIDALRKLGRTVMMVGDGLNDAPALASADVSMSPSSALDIAQNAADIVFQGDKLAPVIEALTVAIRAERLVKQNFILSFAYNVVAVPIAMIGLVTPLVAAVAMAGSSILVVLNAQRISLNKRAA